MFVPEQVVIESVRVVGVTAESQCGVSAQVSPDRRQVSFDVRDFSVASRPDETVYEGCYVELRVTAPEGQRYALTAIGGGGSVSLPDGGWAYIDVRAAFEGELRPNEQSSELRGPIDTRFTLPGSFAEPAHFSRCQDARALAFTVMLGVAAPDGPPARVSLDSLGGLRFALTPC